MTSKLAFISLIAFISMLIVMTSAGPPPPPPPPPIPPPPPPKPFGILNVENQPRRFATFQLPGLVPPALDPIGAVASPLSPLTPGPSPLSPLTPGPSPLSPLSPLTPGPSPLSPLSPLTPGPSPLSPLSPLTPGPSPIPFGILSINDHDYHQQHRHGVFGCGGGHGASSFATLSAPCHHNHNMVTFNHQNLPNNDNNPQQIFTNSLPRPQFTILEVEKDPKNDPKNDDQKNDASVRQHFLSEHLRRRKNEEDKLVTQQATPVGNINIDDVNRIVSRVDGGVEVDGDLVNLQNTSIQLTDPGPLDKPIRWRALPVRNNNGNNDKDDDKKYDKEDKKEDIKPLVPTHTHRIGPVSSTITNNGVTTTTAVPITTLNMIPMFHHNFATFQFGGPPLGGIGGPSPLGGIGGPPLGGIGGPSPLGGIGGPPLGPPSPLGGIGGPSPLGGAQFGGIGGPGQSQFGGIGGNQQLGGIINTATGLIGSTAGAILPSNLGSPNVAIGNTPIQAPGAVLGNNVALGF